MQTKLFRIIIAALPFIALSAPARADDCSPVMSALLATTKKPYNTTINRTNAKGESMTSHMIQTPTTKYIERNGKWVSMEMSIADSVADMEERFKTGKATCKHLGSDSVNGQSASVYSIHADNEGTVSDNKLWISSASLMLKSETRIDGQPGSYSSIYNYDNVKAPADATPLGAKR